MAQRGHGSVTSAENNGGTTWGTESDRGSVAHFAEEVAARSGFAVCGVEVLRADQMLEFVVVHGSGPGEERLLGRATPLDLMDPVFDCGATYGDVTFVAAEWMTDEVVDLLHRYGYVPNLVVPEQADSWRAEDLLVVRLCDDHGNLRGLLHLDEPLSGRRPTRAELKRLAEDLHLTVRGVVTALEREELAQSAILADAARRVIRQASAQMKLDELLRLASEQLLEGFRARELQFHLKSRGTYSHAGTTLSSPETVRAITEAVERAWRHHQVVIMEPDHAWGDDGVLAPHLEELAAIMADQGNGQVVLVPVGTAETYLGLMVIARAPGGQPWTTRESTAALEVGHDLARAVLNARAHAREQEWIQELRRLDRYRSQMVATVTHELRNPLGVILGHLELMEEEDDVPERWRRSLVAMRRAASRLDGVSQDLLTLNRLDATDTPRVFEPVDLLDVVTEAVELAELEAARREVNVEVQVGMGPFVILGDRAELARVVTNLLSNAIKYSDPGDCVALGLEADAGAVVIFCRDEGIGISEDDQSVLFEEFFRSTNSDALERPGTGLGLPIVRRIVQRHGGRITFTSALGQGTTFTVLFPRQG